MLQVLVIVLFIASVYLNFYMAVHLTPSRVQSFGFVRFHAFVSSYISVPNQWKLDWHFPVYILADQSERAYFFSPIDYATYLVWLLMRKASA